MFTFLCVAENYDPDDWEQHKQQHRYDEYASHNTHDLLS
jgi:hypothetical protein